MLRHHYIPVCTDSIGLLPAVKRLLIWFLLLGLHNSVCFTPMLTAQDIQRLQLQAFHPSLCHLFFKKKCTSLFSFCTQESAVHWRTARQCAREQQVVEVEQSTFWTGTNAAWGWAETRLGQTTRHQCGIFYLKKKGKETQLNQCTNVAMFKLECPPLIHIYDQVKSHLHIKSNAH